MVLARPAVTVVARAKDSAATAEGYCNDGGGGNKDDSKSNSSKIGERSGNSGGGASHLCLIFFFLVGLTTDKVTGSFSCSIHNCHVMTQTTVRQLHVNWRSTLSDSSKGTRNL